MLLWDVAAGAALGESMRHEGVINSAAFSPDGTRIVTASDDGSARIWDISGLETGEAFEIACKRLGNNVSLDDVREKYGLGELAPICGENAPLPVDWSKLQ